MTAISNDLYFIFLSLRFEFGNLLKRKRILVAVAFAILIPVLGIFVINLPDYTRSIEFYKINEHIVFLVRALGFSCFPIISFTAILLASGSISDEFDRKTGLLLFPTPQRRISIFAGKYLAAIAGVLLVVSIIYIVVTAQVIGLYGAGSIPAALIKSYLLAALFSCSVVSVIYFLSSLFKKALTSAFIGLFLLFLVLPGLGMLMDYLDFGKWFLLTSHTESITAGLWQSRIIPEGTVIEHSTLASFEFGTPIAVMITYAIAFFAAGTWIAKRKDMN